MYMYVYEYVYVYIYIYIYICSLHSIHVFKVVIPLVLYQLGGRDEGLRAECTWAALLARVVYVAYNKCV